jgi:hypothetical protein
MQIIGEKDNQSGERIVGHDNPIYQKGLNEIG